jgi:hypothetical protein
MVTRTEEDYYSGNTPLSVLYGLASQDMPVGGDEVREAIHNFERSIAVQTLNEVLDAIDNPQQRIGLGWEAPRDVVKRMIEERR